MFNRLDYTISQLNKNKTVLKQLNWLKKYIMEYPLSRIYVVDGYTTTDGNTWDEEIAGIEKSSVITFDDISVKIGDIIIARQGMRMPLYMVTSTETQSLFYNVTFIGYLQGKDGIDGMQGPRGATGPQGPQGPQGLNGKRGYGVFLSTVTNAHGTTDTLLTGDIVDDHVRPIETGDIIIAINSPNSPVFYAIQVDRITESIDVAYAGSLRTFSVEDLEPLIEGSDTVVVDVNEEGTALEVHLDGSVTSKIDRALLQPVSAPTETSFVAVLTNNSQANVPQSTLINDFATFFLQKPTSVTEESFVVVTPDNNQVLIPYSVLEQATKTYAHYITINISSPSFTVTKPADVEFNTSVQKDFGFAFYLLTSATHATPFTDDTFLPYLLELNTALPPLISPLSFMSVQGSFDMYSMSTVMFTFDGQTLSLGTVGTYFGDSVFPIAITVKSTENSTFRVTDQVIAM